jgi:hypothetical protein
VVTVEESPRGKCRWGEAQEDSGAEPRSSRTPQESVTDSAICPSSGMSALPGAGRQIGMEYPCGWFSYPGQQVEGGLDP